MAPEGNAFASTLSVLDPDTLYYVRAYATNADGTGYGNEVTFTSIHPGGDATAELGNIASAESIGLPYIVAGTAPPEGVSALQMPTFRPHLLTLGLGPLSGTTPALPNPTLDASGLVEGLAWDRTTRGGMGNLSGYIRQPRGHRSTRKSANICPDPFGLTAGVPITADLVALYSAAHVDGTELTDMSGNGNHGTIVGGASVAGTGSPNDPYHLEMDASDDVVTLPDLGLGEDNGFTYEALVHNTGARVESSRWLVCESGVSPIRWGIQLYNGYFFLTTRDDTDTSQKQSPTQSYATDGAWHWVTGTCDGSELRLYVDGVLLSGTNPAPRPAAALTYSRIGARRGTSADLEFWEGGIAGVRLYSACLSAADIAYNASCGPKAVPGNWWG